jgi:hypothetical protein
MSTLGLTAYVLIWPVLATIVLVVLCVGLVRDLRAAKRQGKELV